MNTRLIILTGLLVILLAGGAFGQDEAAIENDYEAKDDDWRFIISPYAMLASQATDVGGEHHRPCLGLQAGAPRADEKALYEHPLVNGGHGGRADGDEKEVLVYKFKLLDDRYRDGYDPGHRAAPYLDHTPDCGAGKEGDETDSVLDGQVHSRAHPFGGSHQFAGFHNES